VQRCCRPCEWVEVPVFEQIGGQRNEEQCGTGVLDSRQRVTDKALASLRIEPSRQRFVTERPSGLQVHHRLQSKESGPVGRTAALVSATERPVSHSSSVEPSRRRYATVTDPPRLAARLGVESRDVSTRGASLDASRPVEVSGIVTPDDAITSARASGPRCRVIALSGSR